MLWQDEGETVCVAQTVLTEGIPKGMDGTNFFSQEEDREYGENQEWKLHPWFQFYWIALFFSFFEQTTFMARFPFALLGIATVLLSFFLARRLWRDARTAWFLAIAFLMNIFFLLLADQARYYAPVMFVFICFVVFITLLMSFIVYKGNLGDYTAELQIPQEGTGRYLGPMEGIVNFVQNECKTTDKIAILFGDLPLKFYLDNPICGDLAGDLPENLDKMDMVTIRRNPIHQMDLKVQTKLNQYVQANLDQFNAFGWRVQDMLFENRETPEEHRYEPWQGNPTNPIVIHKRKQ